jgi:hypothetical protein
MLAKYDANASRKIRLPANVLQTCSKCASIA